MHPLTTWKCEQRMYFLMGDTILVTTVKGKNLGVAVNAI